MIEPLPKMKRWYRWAVKATFTRDDQVVRVKLVRGHTFKLFARQNATALDRSPEILLKIMETVETGHPIFVDFDVVKL